MSPLEPVISGARHILFDRNSAHHRPGRVERYQYKFKKLYNSGVASRPCVEAIDAPYS